MNPGIEYYRIDGQQAFASVLVKGIPAAGKTVTVQGIVYTFGTNFFGRTVNEIVESLASAINADRSRPGLTAGVSEAAAQSTYDPRQIFFAMWRGTCVYLIASMPGTLGNAYTLATSDSTNFGISGATFSGGTDGPLTTLASGGSVAPTTTWAEHLETVAATGVAQTLTAGNFKRAIVTAGYANVADLYIGPNNSTRTKLFAGQTYVIENPNAGQAALAAWYIKGTINDTAIVTYAV